MISLYIKKDEFSTTYFQKDIHLLEIEDNALQMEYSERKKQIFEELDSLTDYTYIVCKHDFSDLPCIHALEAANFELISVDIELNAKINGESILADTNRSNVIIKKYDQKYESNIHDLLKQNLRFFDSTHFYKSPYLDNKLCDVFYREWILKNINGRSNENYIAIYDNEIVGFIFSIKDQDKIIIDLMWVKESFRKMGIGKNLIKSIFRDENHMQSFVKTQITNYAAIRLYEKMGFNLTKVLAVFHKLNNKNKKFISAIK